MEKIHIKFWLENAGALKKSYTSIQRRFSFNETLLVMFFVLTLHLILISSSEIKCSSKIRDATQCRLGSYTGCLSPRADVSFRSLVEGDLIRSRGHVFAYVRFPYNSYYVSSIKIYRKAFLSKK